MTQPSPVFLMPPEPPPGAVIAWSQQFTAGGTVYTFVAIHIAGHGWYVSDASEMAYNWGQLHTYLVRGAAISIVTGWGNL